jgi:hypothetical protein
MPVSRLALIMFLDGGGGRPDNSLPGAPVYPSQGPGFPTHPIAPGGGGPVDPGYGIPDFAPARPSHPIHFPPVTPDNTLPGDQPIISLPIVLPDRGQLPIGPDQKFELKWSPYYGWVLVPVKDDEAEPK